MSSTGTNPAMQSTPRPELSGDCPTQTSGVQSTGAQTMASETGGEQPKGKAAEVSQRAQEMAGAAREKAQHAVDAAREKTQQAVEVARERAQHAVEDARENAMQYYAQGREKAGELQGQLETYIRQEPVKSLAVAAGVGFALGLLLVRR